MSETQKPVVKPESQQQGAFLSPEIEQQLSANTAQVMSTQLQAQKIKEAAVESYNPSLYEERVLFGTKPQEFVALLGSDEVQEDLDKVILNEQGLDLILHGLTEETATAKNIRNISNIVQSQEMRGVIPRTVETVEDKQVATPHYDKAAKYPRYISRFDQQFGPYHDGSQDTFQAVLQKLDPKTWLLLDEERDFYTNVVWLDEMVKEPTAYMPMPHRRMPDQKLHRLIKNPRKEKQHAKDQAENLKKREKDGKGPITQEDIEFTKRVHAHWQGRSIEDMITHVKLKPEDEQAILDLVKKEAQEKIQRDDELRALVV